MAQVPAEDVSLSITGVKLALESEQAGKRAVPTSPCCHTMRTFDGRLLQGLIIAHAQLETLPRH